MDALLIPALGTVFWASIAFLVVLFVLRKFAWGPILSALNDREQSIAGALNEADRVRKEMEALAASNENQLQEARAEREKMMREAREMADQMISEAKNKARDAADKEIASAKVSIAIERKAAVAELKAEVGNLSLEIAERLLREKLESTDEQKALVNRLIDESPLN